MKILPKELDYKGFHYKQLHRNEYKAIYEQHFKEELIAYEVFYIISHNGYEIMGNKVEAQEIFPKDESFGYSAWTFCNKEKALKRYKQLKLKEE